MAKSQGKGKNRIKFQIGGFENLLTEFDRLGGDVKEILTTVLEDAGEDVGVRTKEAMATSNLPAGGKYSKDVTVKSVLINPQATWNGSTVEIGLGFDKLKDGVGTFLITGTPRMRPNYALEKLFVNKGYMKELNSSISEFLADAIAERMEEIGR